MTSLVRALDFVVLNAAERWLRWRHRGHYALFRQHLDFTPTLSAPTLMSELVQWRKIFDRNPLFGTFLDKLKAKDWALAQDPRIKTARVLWSGKNPSDIPDDLIDANVVIKANHGCGYNYFINADGSYDRGDINAKLNAWLQTDYSTNAYEWGYKNVDRLCFVEELIGPRNELVELSFRCHDGTCSMVSLTLNEKTPDRILSYFWPDGTRVTSDGSPLPLSYRLPERFAEARLLSEKLSKGVDYIRVDFICHNDDLFFSELTVYPASGLGPDSERAKTIISAWVKKIDLSWFFAQKRHSFFSSLYRNAVARHFQRLAGDRR